MYSIHIARTSSNPLSPVSALQTQDSLSSHTPRYGYISKAYPLQTPPSSGRWLVAPPRGHYRRLCHILVLLLLAAVTLGAAAAGGRTLLLSYNNRRAQHLTGPQGLLYALVIDCGSSGTRIYAYNWTQPAQPTRRSKASPSTSTALLPVVKAIPPSAAAHLVPKHATKGQYHRVETRPGLDAYAANLPGLSSALGPLLDWARAVVPAQAHASTPLFLMGTGGLRRLAPQQQDPLMSEIRRQLGQSGFRFEPHWARVISGDDEGAFGWLALNYQKGRLRPHAQAPAAAAALAGVAAASAAVSETATITSLGALDLGGSSLQITFEVPPRHATTTTSSSGHTPSAVTPPPQYNISVAGYTFQLHLHSFKQYGLNEAYDRGISVLLSHGAVLPPHGAPEGHMGQQQQQRTGGSVAAAGLSSNSSGSNSSTAAVQASSSDSASTTAPAAPLQYPADLAHREQHDIAVARAAGVTSQGGVASTQHPDASASVEHALQADLAAAAAAGYHPQNVLPQQQQRPESATSSAITSSSSSSLPDSGSGGGIGDTSSGSEGALSSRGPRLLGHMHGQQGVGGSTALQGPQPAHTAAAMRRQASRQLRQSMQRQQLQWLQSAGSAHRVLLQQQDNTHDVRLRQLLREYLMRDDPATTTQRVSTLAANSNSSSTVGQASLAPEPTDATSISSRGQIMAQDAAAVTGHSGGSGGSSSDTSELPVVLHPCLHKGYEAVYTRVAYGGVTPQPPKVLLRGLPDWESCLHLVDSIVNSSAPCSVQEHLPSCVLGTPQPELQGHFMALTGFYVVSHFLNVSADSRALEPLLDASKTLCSHPWSWVQQHLGSHVNVERYCTWGPYVVKLLLQGLGLEEQQVFVPQDGDLGWPLGAVLVEASKLPGFSSTAQHGDIMGARHGWKRGSLRGTGVLVHELEGGHAGASSPVHLASSATAATATPPATSTATSAPPAPDHHHSSVVGATAPPGHLQQHPAVTSEQEGVPWSMGLLHTHNHNHSTSGGLHLSGAGWVAVVGVAWLVIVAWCRGVCGHKGVVAGVPAAAAFLPLTTAMLGAAAGGGGGSRAGGGHQHVVGGYGVARGGKMSRSNSFLKARP